MSSLHLLRRLAAVNGKGEQKLLETLAFALHHDRGDVGIVVCGIISPANP